MLIGQVSLSFVFPNNGYILGPAAGQEDSGSAWPLLLVFSNFAFHFTGFWHEQSRSDRDENVKILWNNIKPNMKFNFVKYNQTEIQHLNAPYDTCSVMHYSATAFSQVN